MDKEAFVQLILLAYELQKKEQPPEADINDLREAIQSIRLFEGEIWIGKKDFLPHMSNYKIEYEDKSGNKGKIEISQKLGNFNEPVSIEEPESAKSLAEIIQQVFGAFGNMQKGAGKHIDTEPNLRFGTSTKSNKDSFDTYETYGADEDIDKDGLKHIDELKYRTDPNDADSDDDGYRDGDEVKKGYNPNGPGKLGDN